MINLLLDLRLNLVVIALSVIVYLVNYFVLKLKGSYRGFKYQMFLLFLLPYLNIIFLGFNLLLAVTSIKGYRVVKVKKKAKA